jgi:hypothetical protein
LDRTEGSSSPATLPIPCNWTRYPIFPRLIKANATATLQFLLEPFGVTSCDAEGGIAALVFLLGIRFLSGPPHFWSHCPLMRLSRFFLPILRETPKEAEIVSHRLMLRAGMIRQEASGSYAWLPLGVRVLQKISAIVREEQNRAGAIELLMPTIQSADLWRESGR